MEVECDFLFDDETGELYLIPGCYGTINRGTHACECDVDLDSRMREVLKPLIDNGAIQEKAKCCGKCAFRKNSPERCDPYGWMTLSETLSEGSPFVCHEGLPDHQHQIEGEPVRLCGGWKSMQGRPIEAWLKLAYCDDRNPGEEFS